MDFLTSLVNSMPGAVAQGLIWGIMAIGVYITYRILDVADLTVDGSLGTGGAVCVVLVLNGMPVASPLWQPRWPVCWRALSRVCSTRPAAFRQFWPVF